MQEKINFKKYSKSKKFFCYLTDEAIAPARVEYLLSGGVPEKMLTSLRGAELSYKPRKIIVVDEFGTSYICDKIDNRRAWQEERFGSEAPEEDEEVAETEKVIKFEDVNVNKIKSAIESQKTSFNIDPVEDEL
mgnify:FL=1|jgi:hypothetical protein